MPLVTDPVESISSPFSRWKRHRVGLFSTYFFGLFFFLSCVTPKKARRGGNSYNFINMKPLKTFYILLWREELKRFRLFMRDRLPVPCTSMVRIMFYTDFRFFWRNTLVCQQKVNGKSKKNCRVETTVRKVSGRPRFYWVDWLNPWAGFQWLCYRGVLESSCFCLCLVSKLVSSFTGYLVVWYTSLQLLKDFRNIPFRT